MYIIYNIVVMFFETLIHNMFSGLFLGIVNEGLLYGIVSLGVYITYKILDFPDMSVDGSFPLGMSITAVLLLNGLNPFLALCISFLVGCLVGIITGVIHVKLGVRDLLSGILVMTALYSINLRIAGRPNLPINKVKTIFSVDVIDPRLMSFGREFVKFVILLLIVIICKLLLDYYLKTKNGYLLRSVGDNETLVTSLAKDKGNIKIIGLAIANGFVAFAGSIFVQDRRFFDISAGTGTLVIAVANVIIGMQIMKRFKFLKTTTAVIIGSIVYRACISIAIDRGLDPRDLRLITSILLLIILMLNIKNKRAVKK